MNETIDNNERPSALAIGALGRMKALAYRHGLPLVLLLAFVARVAIVALFPSVFAFDQTGAIHGSDAYDDYAQNLLATGVYGRTPGIPDAMIPPLYSYALAAVYSVFGRGHWQVVLFHTSLDLLSIALLAITTVHLLRGVIGTARAYQAALLTGIFYALYPYLIFQNMTLIDTPFFMTLMHAFVLLLVLLRERKRLDRGTLALAILTGGILGLATLTRPILLPLAALAGVWYLLRLSFWQSIARLGVVAVITLIVLAPWMVRNYQVYGTFVAMSLTAGSNFYQGNNPDTIPFFRAGYDVQWTAPESLQASDPNSPEADRERLQLALDWIADDPRVIGELIWVKLGIHWGIPIAPRFNPTAGEAPRLEYRGDAIVGTDADGGLVLGDLPPGDPVDLYSTPLFDQIGRTVHLLYFGGLLLAAIVGIALTARGWREVSLLWFVQISMTITYVIFHPSTRYRVPSDPLLFIFSAAAIVILYAFIRARLAQRSSAASAS